MYRTEQERNEARQRTQREANQRYYDKKKKEQRDAKHERRSMLQVRVRETLLGRIRRIINEGIATGRFGYKTMSEAVEDLLIRGLSTLKGDETVDEMLPYMDAVRHFDRLSEQRKEAMVLLNRARTEIDELLRIGGEESAASYFHATMEAVYRLPATDWRDWLIKELKTKYPQLTKMEGKPLDPMKGLEEYQHPERRKKQKRVEEKRKKKVGKKR